MKKILFLLSMTAALPGLVAVPATAQETPETAQERRLNDGDVRVQLARRVHEYRPIAAQVRDALEYIGADLPPQERALFQASVMANMDIEALQDNSVQAMAQVYTAGELQTMIDYYSQPESDAIERKSNLYRERIDPQIVEAINDSLDQVRENLAGQGPMARR